MAVVSGDGFDDPVPYPFVWVPSVAPRAARKVCLARMFAPADGSSAEVCGRRLQFEGESASSCLSLCPCEARVQNEMTWVRP